MPRQKRIAYAHDASRKGQIGNDTIRETAGKQMAVNVEQHGMGQQREQHKHSDEHNQLGNNEAQGQPLSEV